MKESSLTMNFFNSRIRFKLIYQFSIFFFVLSLILFPISIKWSTFCIFTILGVWTMIPGFVSSFLSRLVMTDVFTYILSLYYGFWIAFLYVVLTAVLWVFFGPRIPPMIVFRDGVALIVSAFAASFMPYFINHIVTGYLVFMIIGYSTYYLLLVLLSPNELWSDLLRFPTNFYFDFILTGGLLKIFDKPLQSLLEGNLYAVWPFMIIIGLVIGVIHFISKKFFSIKKEEVAQWELDKTY